MRSAPCSSKDLFSETPRQCLEHCENVLHNPLLQLHASNSTVPNLLLVAEHAPLTGGEQRYHSRTNMAESHPLESSVGESDLRQRDSFTQMHESVQQLLTDIADFGTALAHKNPAELGEDAGTFEGLGEIDQALGAYFHSSYELKQRFRTQRFSVALLALAKSGASQA